MRIHRSEDGFNVTELMVVLGLLSIVVVMMFAFLAGTSQHAVRTETNSQAETDTQILLRTVTEDVRAASAISTTYPTTGTCPAGGTFASPYTGYRTCISFTILRPTGTIVDCPRTEVVYGLVNGQLRMDRKEYRLSGASCVVGATTTGKVILDKVNNGSTPLFQYLSRPNVDLVAAGESPIDAASIKVSLKKTYSFGTGVSLSFAQIVALRNKR